MTISGETILSVCTLPRLDCRERQVRDPPDKRPHQVSALLLPDGMLQRHLQRQLELAGPLQENPRQGHHDAQPPAGKVLGADERGGGKVSPLDSLLVHQVCGVSPVRRGQNWAKEEANTGQDIRVEFLLSNYECVKSISVSSWTV